ncbi:hypothetical protein, conserved [Babesia ovata]|uniref:Uncharacterized protein n=1 Tax=Babesia ovata TaxID=189622 RepID=A0A2H6K708_9APIC|nr:uncharacterized protein BOVATA_002640 [Babesia ovata]GBE58771.1 hypothetical protein, conserved [Babesia ovata]
MALNSEELQPVAGEHEDSGLHAEVCAGVSSEATVLDGNDKSSEEMGDQIPETSQDDSAGSRTGWEAAVLATQTAITEDLESYKVRSELPITASIMPCVLDQNTKMAGEAQGGEQGTVEPVPGAVLMDSYYQLPPKELIALAAAATRSSSLFSFKKEDRRPARRPKADDPRTRNSTGHEDGRHGNLIPYEPLLEPMTIPGHDQPLEPETGFPKPRHPQLHEQRIGGNYYPKHPGRHRDHMYAKGGPHVPGDRRPKYVDAQQLIAKQNAKARGFPGGANRWSAPRPTDGIFSLGSLRPETPHVTPKAANEAHAMSFNSISRMVQDLHLKKLVSLRNGEDVLNMTTQDVSNFTFIDEESHVPLKSSQFSKIFSVVGQQHKAEQARLAAEGERADTPGFNVAGERKRRSAHTCAGDAKNRERASQLLQQMLARKTSP